MYIEILSETRNLFELLGVKFILSLEKHCLDFDRKSFNLDKYYIWYMPIEKECKTTKKITIV